MLSGLCFCGPQLFIFLSPRARCAQPSVPTMKKAFYLLLVLAMGTAFACNNGTSSGDTEETSGTDTEQADAGNDMSGMISFPLSDIGMGMPVALMVPDTSAQAFDARWNDAMGTIELRVGKSFQVQVSEFSDLEMAKADLQNAEPYVNTILQEEGNLILYKSVIPDSGIEPAHHFYAVVSVDGIDYAVSDIVDGNSFSKEAAEYMLKAALSLKALNAAS